MANMSYCRFQNTHKNLGECVDAMDEMLEEGNFTLSKDERRAMDIMYDLCQVFLDNYRDIKNAEENGYEGDGQPSEAQEWQDYDADC
jgi:hypothetical protein